MSEVAIRSGRRTDAAFAPVTIAVLLAVGVLGFIGSLLLGAYAPDLRSGRNAGAHALSNAATGYAGLVALARATGRNPRILRGDRDWDTEDLVVLTPESGRVDMSKVLAARRGRATLVVLPKWSTVADEDVKGWVDAEGLLPLLEPEGVLAPQTRLALTRAPSGGHALHAVAWAPQTLAVAAPRPLQAATGAALTPLVTDDRGRVVLGAIGGGTVYVLTDPDLLSNFGLRRLDRARAALDLLDFVNATGAHGIAFDVTLNGLGRGHSPLKLALEPPFLAMTLAVAVALALAGWQALVRFGAPQPRRRAIAFGKTALIDNSAMMIRKAGREGGLGPRYAALIRDRARAIFAVPIGASDAEADRYLDRLHGSARFTDLAQAADRAEHRADMLAAARALYRWQWEKTL